MDWSKYRANLFVVEIITVYLLWKLAHHFLVIPGSAMNGIWLHCIEVIGSFYAHITSAVLNVFGEQTIHNGIRIIYTNSGKNILVEDHCLAIPAIVVFVGSILLFTGSWKNKLWFLPLGVFGVFLINTVRLVFLSYTFEHFSTAFFDINHSFVYLVVTYTLIMLMIAWWMKRFSVTVK